MKTVSIPGIVMGLAGCALAWQWYGWRLAVVLLLVGWCHNLQKHRGTLCNYDMEKCP